MSDVKSELEGQAFQPFSGEADEVEILEVVGLDEDSPAASPVEAEEAGPAQEIEVGLDDDGSPDGEVASDRERLLRLQADFDNLKKRVQREREDYEHHATATLVSRLLPVLDNFERAVAAQARHGGGDSLLDGVLLIFRQLLDELRKEGLEAIESVGQPFDPTLHDAVETEISRDYPSHTVVEELQRGYRLHNRLLRPALVRVSLDGSEGKLHG